MRAMRCFRLWLICLALAIAGCSAARAGPPQRRRQLFDPRRFRTKCRRRSRQRHHAGRPRWRRARLYAGAGGRQEDRGRQTPRHQRSRSGGLAAAAACRPPAARRRSSPRPGASRRSSVGVRCRSACLAIGAQCEDLCRQYPRCAGRRRPGGCRGFSRQAQAYLAKLDALDREVREAVKQIPQARRKVISTHDAFGYFAAGLWHRVHRAARRFHRIRGQRPRYRRDHHARSKPRKFRPFFLKISAIPG